MQTNITEIPNITDIPEISFSCRFCKEFNITCRLGIEDKDDIEKRDKLLEHYREKHHNEFMDYCRRNEPSRLKPTELWNEGLKLLKTDNDSALEKFLFAEELLLEDSLFLAVRLGTFRETEEEIKKLTKMSDRVVQLTKLLDELESNTDKNLEE